MAKRALVKREKHPLDTLKKSVAAIHTSGELSLLERKTANVLLLNAYQNLVAKRTHKISVPLLCAMLGYDSHDIDKLKTALRKLASTTLEFNVMGDGGKESWKTMSMISYGAIEDGVCTYRYDEYLAERLYDPEIYATINMAVQRKFDSGYALTLYENCLRYKSVGSTGWWEIDRFRSIMGASAPVYDEFKYLKREVVTKPLMHVNKVSDIQLTAEFQKKGRQVTAIRFLIAESQQQSLLSHEATDQYAAIRDHGTYKRLVDHGIGDRLALLWVMEDEQRARAVIEYVELRDKKKQVKGSTAGYIRKLIEDKVEIRPSAYEKDKAKAQESQTSLAIDGANRVQQEDAKVTFKAITTTARIDGLAIEEKRAYAARYIEEVGIDMAKTYQPETVVFIDPVEKARFRTWFRDVMAPEFDIDAFKKWLAAQGNASLKQNGIPLSPPLPPQAPHSRAGE